MNRETIAFRPVPAAARKAYLPPRLSVLGAVGNLTEAGSAPGFEPTMTTLLGCTSDASSNLTPNPMC